MCGIFGCSLKKGANHRVALQKFKILGLYNIKRGRDASGVFIDGEIIKGVGTISEFDDFLEKTILPIPRNNGILIGHTRQGSVGYKKTIDEAHPFLINENLVFSHNGTIKNVKELCVKYGLTESDYTVDSQVLGTLLDREGPEILEEYIGAAALAYTYKNEPDKLYLYHGQSKEFKHGIALEERPLYFVETKDGVFYSSLEDSLKAIIDNDKEVVQNLNYNHVFVIENGKFTGFATKIERIEKNVTTYTAPAHNYNHNNYSTMGKQKEMPMLNYGKNNDKTSLINTNSKGVSVSDIKLIKRESLPIKIVEMKSEERKNFIYFHMGRYWQVPRILLEGPIWINKNGSISVDPIASKADLRFFHRGVLLRSVEAFEEIRNLQKSSSLNWVKDLSQYNFAIFMSKYSLHPVTNMNLEGSNVADHFRYCWYFNGDNCKDLNFHPMYSNRNYKIVKGFLSVIKFFQRERTLWETSDIAINEINALESGTLLSGISGGGSTGFFPNQEKEEITIDSFQKNKDFLWFFDIPFTSYEKGMENIGEDEIKALKKFIELTTMKDFNIKPSVKEIDTSLAYLLNEACNKKKTIKEVLLNKEEEELLEWCYDTVLSRDTNIEIKLQSKLKNIVSDLVQIDKNTEDMNINEKVENIIIGVEDLQADCIDLLDVENENNEYAQDIAQILLVNIPNILETLKNVLDKHDKTDLKKRVEKLLDKQLL